MNSTNSTNKLPLCIANFLSPPVSYLPLDTNIPRHMFLHTVLPLEVSNPHKTGVIIIHYIRMC